MSEKQPRPAYKKADEPIGAHTVSVFYTRGDSLQSFRKMRREATEPTFGEMWDAYVVRAHLNPEKASRFLGLSAEEFKAARERLLGKIAIERKIPDEDEFIIVLNLLPTNDEFVEEELTLPSWVFEHVVDGLAKQLAALRDNPDFIEADQRFCQRNNFAPITESNIQYDRPFSTEIEDFLKEWLVLPGLSSPRVDRDFLLHGHEFVRTAGAAPPLIRVFPVIPLASKEPLKGHEHSVILFLRPGLCSRKTLEKCILLFHGRAAKQLHRKPARHDTPSRAFVILQKNPGSILVAIDPFALQKAVRKGFRDLVLAQSSKARVVTQSWGQMDLQRDLKARDLNKEAS